MASRTKARSTRVGDCWCPHCSKVGWTSQHRAIRGALILSAEHGQPYRVYRDRKRCPLWHLTTAHWRGGARKHHAERSSA